MAGHTHRPPAGYIDNKEDVLRRLRKAEGQVRGLQRMVGTTLIALTC
jgi:hypothetical protein